MHAYDKYWLVNLLRGLLAVLASAGVAYLPMILDSTLSRLIFLPFAIAISLVCFSLYGIIDSALLVAVGCVIRKPRTVHWLVILQGLFALTLLAFITIFSKDDLHLRFFMYFAPLQALSSGLAEALIAIGARHHQGTMWFLACAAISLICCVALVFGGDLSAADQARVILGYLTVRGISLSLLSVRMIYIAESPTHRHGLWNVIACIFRAKRQATV